MPSPPTSTPWLPLWPLSPPVATKKGAVDLVYSTNNPAAASPPAPTDTFPDAATHVAYLALVVPHDYVSGDISVKLLLRATVGSGTAVIRRYVNRFRNGAAVITIDSDVAQNYVAANTNTNIVTVTIAAANFTHGDALRVSLVRLGADGSDNLAGSVRIDGVWFEYTA